MKTSVSTLLTLAFALHSSLLPAAAPEVIPAPPQDQGLPYTRSARQFGLAKIKGSIAVCAGSRYAYVYGYKVRLDEGDLRHGEAVLKDGQIYVPARFAAVLDLKSVQPPAPPAYLANKWVYTLGLPTAASVATVSIEGKPYVELAGLAAAKGLKVSQQPGGLLLIGAREITFGPPEAVLLETVITLFDTPDKFADPDLATKYIPTLQRQGKWTDHVKVTPEQLAVLNGPAPTWPTAPKSAYDLSGFNEKLLGSKVPPPGVYPRVLFSPEDVPMLAARVKSSKLGEMSLIEMEYLFKHTWWDPATSDGQVFAKLSSGHLAGLEWDVPPGTSPNLYPALFKGQKPDIFNTHVAYVPECLTSMALYCLLTGDDEHGRQAAAAIANWYKLREPLVDELDALSDSEFGSSYTRPDGSIVASNGSGAETTWRTVQGAVSHMNLGLSLDFAGKWMTPEEKDAMRRIIVKSTYGRRPYGQDGSQRFRDVNWVAWDLPPFLALSAIEGLEGFDPEAYESDCETVRCFCDWGIDESGVVYESNGKTPGSLRFESLAMVALARRGENLWGHPHWRKFLQAQVQMTSPTGRVTVNSGTQYSPYSRQNLSWEFVDHVKAFFPGDRAADYLMGRGDLLGGKADDSAREWMIGDFDPQAYRQEVSKLRRLRLPGITYPGFVRGVLYDTDFEPTSRADLNLPLDFIAPVHGVFSSYSDRSREAAWINMIVRPDHYIGAGHHHADAGMIHFSGAGVDWFTQSPFDQAYDGKYFNLVQVDGHSEAENLTGVNTVYNAAAKFLGGQTQPSAASAVADLTEAYSYRWLTQPNPIWSDQVKELPWEMEPSARILHMFAGTAREKMRFWWPTYTYCNYIATSRAPFNPMQYVFRTAALVRGPHPYGLVADDLKKDANTHLYQWAAMLNGGVWKADVPGLAPGQTALAYRAGDPNLAVKFDQPAIVPQSGEPLLLVCALGLEQSGQPGLPLFQVESADGPPDRKGQPQFYNRLLVNARGAEERFKVLLIPMRLGDEPPKVSFDAASDSAKVAWKDQADTLEFRVDSGVDQRTRVTVSRDGAALLQAR